MAFPECSDTRSYLIGCLILRTCVQNVGGLHIQHADECSFCIPYIPYDGVCFFEREKNPTLLSPVDGFQFFLFHCRTLSPGSGVRLDPVPSKPQVQRVETTLCVSEWMRVVRRAWAICTIRIQTHDLSIMICYDS